METKVGKCLCGEPERVITENGKQVLERCPLYIKLLGKDPQTGAPIEEWGCSIAWIPVLLIETTQQTRQAGAAIESFRNEMVQGNERTLQVLLGQSLKVEALPEVKFTDVKVIGGNSEDFTGSE